MRDIKVGGDIQLIHNTDLTHYSDQKKFQTIRYKAIRSQYTIPSIHQVHHETESTIQC